MIRSTFFDGKLTSGPVRITLLELTAAVTEMTSDDCEALSLIHSLIASGSVRLIGQFCEAHIDSTPALAG